MHATVYVCVFVRVVSKYYPLCVCCVLSIKKCAKRQTTSTAPHCVSYTSYTHHSPFTATTTTTTSSRPSIYLGHAIAPTHTHNTLCCFSAQSASFCPLPFGGLVAVDAQHKSSNGTARCAAAGRAAPAAATNHGTRVRHSGAPAAASASPATTRAALHNHLIRLHLLRGWWWSGAAAAAGPRQGAATQRDNRYQCAIVGWRPTASTRPVLDGTGSGGRRCTVQSDAHLPAAAGGAAGCDNAPKGVHGTGSNGPSAAAAARRAGSDK